VMPKVVWIMIRSTDGSQPAHQTVRNQHSLRRKAGPRQPSPGGHPDRGCGRWALESLSFRRSGPRVLLGGAARRAAPPNPLPHHLIGVRAGVPTLSLLLGDGGDEFAAEDGDVGDHAAPDQVRDNREKLEQVLAGLLGWDMNRFPSSTGVLAGVGYEGAKTRRPRI
jgi:hypothetical protein